MPERPTIDTEEQEPQVTINSQTKMPANQRVSKQAIITLLVLVYINLLNYMDRFTVSGK